MTVIYRVSLRSPRNISTISLVWQFFFPLAHRSEKTRIHIQKNPRVPVSDTKKLQYIRDESGLLYELTIAESGKFETPWRITKPPRVFHANIIHGGARVGVSWQGFSRFNFSSETRMSEPVAYPKPPPGRFMNFHRAYTRVLLRNKCNHLIYIFRTRGGGI